jgi:hypothetical protein
MALKDLIKPDPTPAAERPPGITCEKYAKGEGKRCAHYIAGGACALPDEFMCVEWLKHNGPAPAPASAEPAEAAPQPLERDLFGNPVPVVVEPPRAKQPAQDPLPRPVPTVPVVDIDQLRGFTSEDIASFKALGVEVQLESESCGEIWLVPEYTGQNRREITPEHAATLARVLSVFPGARVVAFHKPPKPERPERPEQRS